MRIFSDRILRENGNTFYVHYIIPENRDIYEIMWRKWYSQTGHRWQHNKAHAHCMLNN
jgi:hypothetical protein